MEPYDVIVTSAPFSIDSMMESGIAVITSYRGLKVKHMYDWIAFWEYLRLRSNKLSNLSN